MEETLEGALAALFKEQVPPPAGLAGVPAGPGPAATAGTRAREALSRYDRATARLKAGDWRGFGEDLDALRPLLEELSRHPSGH